VYSLSLQIPLSELKPAATNQNPAGRKTSNMAAKPKFNYEQTLVSVFFQR